jgi:hypothetical protein
MLSPTKTMSVFFTSIVDFRINILFYLSIFLWPGSCLSVVQRGGDAMRHFQIPCQVLRPRVLFTVRVKGEKMLSKILRGAVLATFAVGATVAQANPFDGYSNRVLQFDKPGSSYAFSDGYRSVNVNDTNGADYNGIGGQFKGVFGDTSDTTPGGHLKLLHLWPGQTPPPRCGGTSGTLVGCGVLGNAAGGFFQSPALAFELEQVTVMHEAVE